MKRGSASLIMLLLSRFSHVQLCATPETAAHQAPPSLGLSRQEHWSGLLFPSPMHESESEVAQSCLTLSNPMDCSLPGSSIHGDFQARVLEWVAIAFSDKTTWLYLKKSFQVKEARHKRIQSTWVHISEALEKAELTYRDQKLFSGCLRHKVCGDGGRDTTGKDTGTLYVGW